VGKETKKESKLQKGTRQKGGKRTRKRCPQQDPTGASKNKSNGMEAKVVIIQISS